MNESVGVVTRERRVRVLNVSRSGCLIESQRPLDVGTVGRLHLRFGIEEYSDDVQVVRCQPIRGAGAMFHIGLRFLWTTPYHAGSIRHGVKRWAAAFERDKGRVM